MATHYTCALRILFLFFARFRLLCFLCRTALLKSKKVFDNSKVTDHHAIIPTGQHPQNLTDMERRVFDLIARRFIAVFYPDCKFATTTVLGEVESIEFKATGKQILEPGWRIIFGIPSAQSHAGAPASMRPQSSL